MSTESTSTLVKNLVLPVVVATITGIASSYVGVNVTLSIMETRISYIEKNGERRLLQIETKMDKLVDSIRDVERVSSANKQQIDFMRRSIPGGI